MNQCRTTLPPNWQIPFPLVSRSTATTGPPVRPADYEAGIGRSWALASARGQQFSRDGARTRSPALVGAVTVSVTILIPVSQPARLRLKVLPITIGRSDRQAPFTPSVGDLANAARRLSLGAALTLLATTTALLGGVFQLGRTVGPRPQGADVGETRCRREVAGGSTAEL